MTALGSVQSDGYTADGLRVWKTNSSGTTYFLYDGGMPVCELNSSGAVTATNTFGKNGLISRNSASASTFYAFDAQGSVAQRLNSSGSTISSSLTDAFGTTAGTISSDPYSGFGSKWGYYTDFETGLQLLGHRFYDPNRGRFINRDPTSYNGGINLYGYCRNDATHEFDSSGTDPVNTGSSGSGNYNSDSGPGYGPGDAASGPPCSPNCNNPLAGALAGWSAGASGGAIIGVNGQVALCCCDGNLHVFTVFNECLGVDAGAGVGVSDTLNGKGCSALGGESVNITAPVDPPFSGGVTISNIPPGGPVGCGGGGDNPCLPTIGIDAGGGYFGDGQGGVGIDICQAQHVHELL
jgi:RHS repeat-associated protein